MKLSAIVAEYNPLHVGHLYHLEHARTLGDHTVVILAGNFVQRGEAAILDKYTRARHAVEAGADLVLELPTAYSISCAEQYALGAVKLLSSLGQEVVLSFGSESGHILGIQQTASLLLSPIDEIEEMIARKVAQGRSFPTARAEAIEAYAKAHRIDIVDVTSPNNILGIEYARANYMLGNPLSLDTIKRTFAYTDKEVSATAVRTALALGENPLGISDYAAKDIDRVHPQNGVLYLSAWRSMSKEEAARLVGADEGLQNRIWDRMRTATTLDEALANAATKRYTSARIRRLATAGLLGLTQDIWEEGISLPPYYSVLAIKENRSELLSLLSKCGEVYVSHKDLSQSDHPFARLDAKADDLFELLRQVKMPTRFRTVKSSE